MANETQAPKDAADMRRYQYAELANRYSKSEENQKYLPGALEKLASDMKEVSETESQLLGDLLKKGQGLESILGIYPGKYEKEKNNLTVEQFVNSYDNVITGYLEKEKIEKLKGALGKMSSSTLGDINKKLDEALYRLIGHKKGYAPLSEEELKNLEGIAEKYKSINDIIKQIEDIYFNELGSPIVKKSNKQILTGLVDKLN